MKLKARWIQLFFATNPMLLVLPSVQLLIEQSAIDKAANFLRIRLNYFVTAILLYCSLISE